MGNGALPDMGLRTDARARVLRPDGSVRWQVRQSAGALAPLWHSRQTSILGNW